jgi:secretion/DNA translocation related TadE-like protein
VTAARADRGSASVWLLSCCALVLVIAAVVTVRGLAVLGRHRAEAGADLAALAAAAQIGVSDTGCAAARRIAAANGSRLTSCRLSLGADGRSGEVVVAVAAAVRLPVIGVRSVRATARAARLPAGAQRPPAARLRGRARATGGPVPAQRDLALWHAGRSRSTGDGVIRQGAMSAR